MSKRESKEKKRKKNGKYSDSCFYIFLIQSYYTGEYQKPQVLHNNEQLTDS